MNQIKQKTKQNKKYDIVVVVAVLATAAMIFAVGTSYMISVQDALAKNRHILNLPLKTKECKHDTIEGPSCKDDSNSSTVPYDPNRCIPGNECPPECPEDGYLRLHHLIPN
jgi:hypothetical protein